MMRILPLASALAIGLALAGCGPVNRGLNSVNQPVVSRTDYVFDAAADGLRDGPDGAEARRLGAWFDALELGYGDRVAVEDAAAQADESVRDTIGSVVARHGLLLSDASPVTAGAGAPGTVRVVVSRTTARVPDCPNWRAPSQPNFAQSTMSNYGCATNSNLAAMIADPADLGEGRAGDGADAATAAKAIRSYRDAAPTGAQGMNKEATKGGN